MFQQKHIDDGAATDQSGPGIKPPTNWMWVIILKTFSFYQMATESSPWKIQTIKGVVLFGVRYQQPSVCTGRWGGHCCCAAYWVHRGGQRYLSWSRAQWWRMFTCVSLRDGKAGEMDGGWEGGGVSAAASPIDAFVNERVLKGRVMHRVCKPVNSIILLPCAR